MKYIILDTICVRVVIFLVVIGILGAALDTFVDAESDEEE